MKITVDLSGAAGHDRSYPIHIGHGILKELPEYIASIGNHDVMIVTDTNVDKCHGARLREIMRATDIRHHIVQIQPGEDSKTMSKFEYLAEELHKFERNEPLLVVAFGGGVVGDLAGFVAACYDRGIPFVQVPTTLLADVDCGVGGKVGVNFSGVKNLLGKVHQPRFVLIDVELLDTLPESEMRSGMAEVIKYALIYDKDFWAFLEANHGAIIARDQQTLIDVVGKCCKIKADVVAQDECDETGERALLNFGHTFGHAIEAASNHGYRHGEAVAIGMVAAAELSQRMGLAKNGTKQGIQALLGATKLPTTWRDCSTATIMEKMRHDKKFRYGRNRFIILVDIGQAQLRDNVNWAVVEDVVMSAKQ